MYLVASPMSLMIMWFSRWSASTGCTATSISPGCSSRVVWSGTSISRWGCRSPRPRPSPSSDRFSAAVHRFARDQQVPWVDFVKGQRKDDVMQEYLAGYTQNQGVVFIGRAQELSLI